MTSIYLCDGRSPGTDDTRELFYKNLKADRPFDILSSEEREDVLARCRLLRNIPRNEAESLVNAMGRTLEAWLERVHPEVILSHMVDEYVLHLLSILGRKRGIPFVGYAGSFFPERIQITQQASGQLFNVRKPDADEIHETLEILLKPNFRQDYSQKLTYNRRQHLFMMARYRFKLFWFKLKGWLEQDSKNVHYLITPYVVERRQFDALPSATYFDSNWSKKIASVTKPLIYLPLAYFPESTIDYWIKDRRILDYEAMTLRMANVLSEKFTVVVKEHPHMLGCRSVSFYAELKRVPRTHSRHAHDVQQRSYDAVRCRRIGCREWRYRRNFAIQACVFLLQHKFLV